MSDKLKEWQSDWSNIRPTIRNDVWWIGEVNTGVSANGLPGAPGEDGQPGESIYISNVSTNAQGGKVILFSDGTTVIIPKGDKGEPGRDADPASSTDTLGDVNNRGNTTDKDIIVNQPKGKWSTIHTAYGILFNEAEENRASIWGSANPDGEGQLHFGRHGRIGALMVVEREDRAGMAFHSRVSGHDARNAIDFVTLRQLRSYDPEVVTGPGYSLQKFKDLIINNTEGFVLNLPDVHSSEYADWNGQKLKIVAHREANTSRAFVNSIGEQAGYKIPAGSVLELMFLDNKWYAV